MFTVTSNILALVIIIISWLKFNLSISAKRLEKRVYAEKARKVENKRRCGVNILKSLALHKRPTGLSRDEKENRRITSTLEHICAMLLLTSRRSLQCVFSERKVQ